MSTGWIIICKACRYKESFHTGRSTDGAEGEEARAAAKSKDPCPKCGSAERQYGHPSDYL